jgi:hypothetical protein
MDSKKKLLINILLSFVGFVAYCNLVFAVSIGVGIFIGACTKPEAKVAETTIVTVADDVCKEISDEVPNDWVTLGCTALDGISKIILRMPRAEWENIRRQTVLPLNQP